MALIRTGHRYAEKIQVDESVCLLSGKRPLLAN